MAGYELTEGFSDSSFFNVDLSNLRVDGGSYNRKYICVLSRIHRSRDFVTVSARFISETLHVMLYHHGIDTSPWFHTLTVAKKTNVGKQLVKKWLTLRA